MVDITGILLKFQHVPDSQQRALSTTKEIPALSRRERQVMDILHRRGAATVAEIMGDLPDPPTYSAVRSVLRILGRKSLITHREDGPRYVYYPAVPTERASEEMLAHVVNTYFGGSAEKAAAALRRIQRGDRRRETEAD